MPIELRIPEVGESITEVQIADWLKAEGDPVAADESVVTLESEKATVELPAPAVGTLTRILKQKGRTAQNPPAICNSAARNSCNLQSFR